MNIQSEPKSNIDIKNTSHIIEAKDVNVFYGSKQALDKITIDIPENQVTSLIGPSGCGKSTFLRCINRMNDLVPICRVNGDIRISGQDIYAPEVDVVALRAMLEWYFKNQIRFQNLFLKMLLTVQKFTASRLINLKWPILLNGHYKKLDYGTR